jgi:hypothetical protein
MHVVSLAYVWLVDEQQASTWDGMASWLAG